MEYRFKFNRMVKLYLLAFSLNTFLIGSSIYAEDAKFKNGIILYEEKYSITAEYLDLGNNKVFVRDDKIGYSIYKDKIFQTVDNQYYQSIKSKTSLSSMFESLYKFDAGSRYQYDYQDKGNFFLDDDFVRPTKIGLLLLTLYTYSAAIQANQRLGDSIYGLNSADKQNTFRRRNSEFILSSILTTTFFISTSATAYFRFGRDSNWNDLKIHGREELNIEQFNSKVNELNSGNKIEFNYVYRF